MQTVEARVHLTRDVSVQENEQLRCKLTYNYALSNPLSGLVQPLQEPVLSIYDPLCLLWERVAGSKCQGDLKRELGWELWGEYFGRQNLIFSCERDNNPAPIQQGFSTYQVYENHTQTCFHYTGVPENDSVRLIFKTNSMAEDDFFEQSEIDSLIQAVNIVWGSRNSVVYNKRCAMPYNWQDIDKNTTRQEIDDFFLLEHEWCDRAVHDKK